MSESPPLPPADAPGKPAVSLDDLQAKALDLLKNPVVLAGGALVVGLLLARFTAGQKLRQTALRGMAELFKTTAFNTLFKDAAAAPPPAPPTPPPPAPEAPWMAAGKQLLDAVAPNLAEQLKKKLADILPNQHN